jgi:hypothetical protein
MKLTIYTGNIKPMIAIGKNQCNLLEFAYKYPGWHTFKQNRSTLNAVRALEKKGYITIINDQFKLK